MTGEPYFKHGPKTISGATVLAEVNDLPDPGLFAGLLNIFLLRDPETSDPIRVRIHHSNDALVETVNSLVGKRVNVVIYRSPWSACGKSGVVNYLQSIEEA